jgi:hypothetical protein
MGDRRHAGVTFAREVTRRAVLRRGVALLATSSAFACVSIVLLAAGARWLMPPTLTGPIAEGGWTSRSRAWFTTDGVFPAEFDRGTGRPFSWMGQTAHLRIPNLDRSRRYRLSVQLSALRPQGTPPPELRMSVDGTLVREAALASARQEISVGLPTRDRGGAVVTIELSNTFAPGGDDPRALGAIVFNLGFTPADGHFRPTGRVLALAWLAAFTAIVGVLFCGLRSRLAATTAAVVAAAFAWLLLQDGAFIGPAVERFVAIGLGTAVIGAVVGLLGWRWPVIGGVPDWWRAAGIALCASSVKLALLGHPLATIGDGIFQVHRAAVVHGGQYFFTSITPRPFFEFPYPVALYVAAQPFWRFFPTELDLLFLLRILTLAADTLVGVTFYGAARRAWDNRSAALLCAFLWPCARAPVEALSNANLTNAFGQAVFGAAMGVFLWSAAGGGLSAWAIALTTLLMATAFLSHFGTATVGACILGAAGVTLVAATGRKRRIGLVLVGVGLAAAAFSYIIYYSHFHTVYRETITRVMSKPDATQIGKLVAPPWVKAQRWWAGQADDFAPPRIPVVVATVAGAVLLFRRRPRDVLSLVLLSWIVVWAGFSALGLLTPVSMRVNLATAPVFVCLSAYALGTLAATSRAGLVLAAVGAVLVASDGLRMCLTCLGVSP